MSVLHQQSNQPAADNTRRTINELRPRSGGNRNFIAVLSSVTITALLWKKGVPLCPADIARICGIQSELTAFGVSVSPET